MKELHISMLPNMIKANIDTIKELQKRNPHIKLKLHNEFIRNKFYIFDDAMYLFFRIKKEGSDKSQIYRIGKDSNIYKAFYEQFIDYWERYYDQT